MIKTVIKQAKKLKFVKWIRINFPTLFLYLVIKPLNIFRFTQEKNLLKGKLKPKNSHPSILLFTTHKCASTLTNKLLGQLCESSLYTQIDLEAYYALTEKDILKVKKDQSTLNKIDKPVGFLFAPLRYFLPFPQIENYKIVLVLRDPRDVLTSYYYSKLYSHYVINKQFKKERAYYKNHSIDQFVLEMASDIKSRYENYINHILPLKNVINLPYELLVTDFPVWIKKLNHFLSLNENQDVIKSIIDNTHFVKKEENQNEQIRNITPGDYKNKLAPETILALNKTLKKVLVELNYAID